MPEYGLRKLPGFGGAYGGAVAQEEPQSFRKAPFDEFFEDQRAKNGPVRPGFSLASIATVADGHASL